MCRAPLAKPRSAAPADARYNRSSKEAALKSFPTIVFACAAVGLALGQSGPKPEPAKLQILIITGQNTSGHDWRATTPVLRKILEDSGRFEVRVTEEFRGAGADTLAPYDVVVLNYYDGKRANLRWGEVSRQCPAELRPRREGAGGCIIFRWRPSTAGRSSRRCAAETGAPTTATTPRATTLP